MQNTFCKSLSNAVSFRIPGESNTLTFNPCCLYDDYIPFHPTIFKRERQKFIEATDFLPACSKCKLKESTHGTSLRFASNRELPSDIGDSIHKLEIVLDTTCNAACIQCGELQSSLWRKQIAEDRKIVHIQPEQQIDSKIQMIKKSVDLQQVKNYHFWGGEPLITDTHLKFLQEIQDPSSVKVMYTTNCSVFPNDNILELWSKFKSVTINLSIDAIEDKFHYIRWPLSWDKVKQNLQSFKNSTPPNINYHVNCCILPLNVFYINELGNWLEENFDVVNNKKVAYAFIRGEGTVDAACTPLSLREEVWRILGEDHSISKVLKEVPIKDPTDMIRHFDRWDKVRNLSWQQTFPEIVKHFK